MVDVTELAKKVKYKRVGYYPGCALEGTGHAYNRSTKAIANKLDLTLKEVKNWNCCGAMEVKNIDPKIQTYLSSRVLSNAVNKNKLDVVMAPCNGCYHNLKKAEYDLAHDAESREVVDRLSQKAKHKTYEAGQAETIHALDWLKEAIGEDELAARVKNSLAGIKVANYYGCMYTRPRHIFPEKDQGEGSESTSEPHFMDDLLAAAGAENVDFPLKTACCGGAHTCRTRTRRPSSCSTFSKQPRRQVPRSSPPNARPVIPVWKCTRSAAKSASARRPASRSCISRSLLGLALGIRPRKLGVQENISDSMDFIIEKRLL